MLDPMAITLLYKYGTTTPAADPNERIRPNDGSDSEIHYDAVEYMFNGGGRYAYAAMFPVVQKYFDVNFQIADGTYSLELIMNATGMSTEEYISSRQLTISHYGTDSAASDHAERAFILGTSAYNLEDTMVFRVENGVKYIDNMSIRPSTDSQTFAQDNFDFQAGSEAAELVGTFLSLLVDASNLGENNDANPELVHTVNMYFDNFNQPIVRAAIYTHEMFLEETSKLDVVAWSIPGHHAMVNTMIYAGLASLLDAGPDGGLSYFKNLLENPDISDFDGTFRTLYGSTEDDTLTPLSDPLIDVGLLADIVAPSLLPVLPFVKYRLVGGDGNDEISGFLNQDDLYGGDGNDTLNGSFGDDILRGGADHNILIGGLGKDSVFYNETDAGTAATSSVDVVINDEVTSVTARAGLQTDELQEIEYIKLSASNDVISASAFNSNNFRIRIDAAGGDDTLDLQAMGSAVVFDSGGWIRTKIIGDGGTGNPIESLRSQIRVTSVEVVEGTHYSDVYRDGTSVNRRVNLGDGNDIVQLAGRGSEIDLGSNGNDVVFWNAQTMITNFGNEDRIFIGDRAFFGASKKMGSTGGAFAFGGMVEVGFSGDDLVINVRSHGSTAFDSSNAMYISGWKNSYGDYGEFTGYGNITLFEHKTTAVRLIDIEPGMGTIGNTIRLAVLNLRIATGICLGDDPLVLDLDGDGFDLTQLSSRAAMFDTDADLYKEHSGWVGRDDGILVRDIGQDGNIEDTSELFGTSTTGGFAVLASLDGNSDGVVNADDDGLADFNGDGVIDATDGFGDLQIWQDLNQDGIAQAGELKSLAEYDIVGLSLATTTTNLTVAGNLIAATANFIRDDGSTGVIGEAWLDLDNHNTAYQGPAITISTDAAARPELKGYGTLVSLRQAMSYDPTIIATVDQSLADIDFEQRDLANLREAVSPLLRAWAEASPVRNPEGNIVSGSANYGEPFSDLTVLRRGSTVMDFSWDVRTTETTDENDVTTYEIEIYMESGAFISLWTQNDLIRDINGVFPTLSDPVTTFEHTHGTTYTYSDGTILSCWSNHAVTSTLSTFEALATGDDELFKYGLDLLVGGDLDFLSRFNGEDLGIRPEDMPEDFTTSLQILTQMAASLESQMNLLAARISVQSGVFASVFTDLIYNPVADMFEVTGDRQLTPTYVNLITMADEEANPLMWLRSWNPLLDTIIADYTGAGEANSNGFLAQHITAAFEAVAPSFSYLTAVEGLGLDPNLFIVGTDTLVGTDDHDIIYLDGEDQTAQGDEGLDNYIVGRDFGHDVIYDYEGPLRPHEEDVVRFTELTTEDVYLVREGTDLVISTLVGDNVLRIQGQFSGEWAGPMGAGYWPDIGVSTIIFADGTSWDKIDMSRAASHADSGSTTVTGTMDNDFMDGGAGNDLLEGYGDGDVYAFGAGYGHDTINDLEDNPYRPAFDILNFRSGVEIDELIYTRIGDSDDVTLHLNDGSTVTIIEQFAATYTLVFGTIYSHEIELFTFDDGGTLSSDDICEAVIAAYSTDGNDSLYGFDREDILQAGLGNDFISGGNEDDIYVFSRGDGNDTIAEEMDNILGGQDDIIYFSPDIAVSDVTFTRDGDDLIATIDDNGGSIRLQDEYEFLETGVFGVVNFNLVEEFSFHDGTILHWRDVMRTVISEAQTPGNDHILGTHFNDEFDAGAGDDLLEGDTGSDTYHFGIGDGHDTVNDYLANVLADDDDVIAFKAGVTQSNIQMSRSGTDLNDLLITLASGDSLKLQDHFGYTTINVRLHEIEHFTFGDGSSLTSGGLRLLYIAQHQTAGHDTIDGFYTNDTMEGGTGNDLLRGGDGSDTYVFTAGFGQDTIAENVHYVTYDDEDVIQFGEGLSASNTVLSRNGEDLTIAFAGSSDRVTLTGQFSHVAWFDGWQDVETIRFADSTTWNLSYIRTRLLAEAGTAGNDTVTGFYVADTIDGGAGNDLLKGLGGGDTYLFGRGSGQDRIMESVDTVYEDYTDTIAFKADVAVADILFVKVGDDLLISIDGTSDTLTVKGHFASGYADIEAFSFADGTTLTAFEVAEIAVANQATTGNDTITGTNRADLIDGDLGNDLLIGNDGSDVYHFSAGFGQDTIQESVDNVSAADNDAIVFGEGIFAVDAVLSRINDDLIISFSGTTDQITIKDQFAHVVWYPSWSDVEHVYFADGTAWTDDSIRLALIAQQQTAGADTVRGYFTADTFDAGAGNDTIYGYGGGDTYHFGRGDGADVIHESVETVYEDQADKIVLDSDVSALDIDFSKVGDDLIIKILGTTDQITVKDYFQISYKQVEKIAFDSGLVYGVTEVMALANRTQPTSGADMLIGTIAIDRMEGGLGADTLKGLSQSDAYVYSLGDGADTIFEDGYADDSDKLVLGAGISTSNLLIARAGFATAVLSVSGQSGSITLDSQFKMGGWGIEQIEFNGGAVWSVADMRSAYLAQVQTTGHDTIWGFDGINDTLTGGNGNDIIRGGTGSDTYSYQVGNGTDTLYEAAHLGDTDRLVLGSGLVATGLSYARSSNNLTLNFTTQAASIILDNQLNVAVEGYGFEQIEFGDGTVWSAADLLYAYAMSRGTAANETINGASSQADFLGGGLGNDTLQGNSGNDWYYYNLGDGADRISEGSSSSDVDRLILGAGLTASSLVISRAGSEGATLTFTGQAGSISLASQFFDVKGYGVEEIQFNDGTFWTVADMRAAYLTQATTAGDDTIRGFNSVDDTLQGGLGNDSLYGYSGADTFIYELGDGADKIYEGSTDGIDRLVFGAGITSSNLVLGRTTYDGLTLSVAGQAGSIYIDNQFFLHYTWGIEEIEFSDATIWDMADMRAAYLGQVQTAGHDIIYGFDSLADALTGGAGNDSIYGGSGSDSYYYALGDGADVIIELSDSGEADVLVLGAGITTANLLIGRTGRVGGTLTVSGQAGSISLQSQFETFTHGVELIQFADGASWDVADMRAAYLSQAQTTGNDTVHAFDGINDSLTGGLGNDSIYGYGGSDTFYYNLGDGADRFYEPSGSGYTDVLVLGAGITTSSLIVTRTTNDHLTLTFSGQSGSIILDNQLFGSGYGFEQVQFSGGGTWTSAQLADAAWFRGATGNDSITATSGNDKIDGGSGNDTINGGSGNDYLLGNGGNDSQTGGSGADYFAFMSGFGKDSVTDFNRSQGDKVEFSTALFADYAAVLAASTQVGADIVITFDANNTVTLKSQTLSSLQSSDFLFV